MDPRCRGRNETTQVRSNRERRARRVRLLGAILGAWLAAGFGGSDEAEPFEPVGDDENVVGAPDGVEDEDDSDNALPYSPLQPSIGS